MYKKLCALLLSLSIFVFGAVSTSAMDAKSVKESTITDEFFETIPDLVYPDIIDPDITYPDIDDILGDIDIEDPIITNVSASVGEKTTNSAIVYVYTNSTGSFTLDLYRDYDDSLVYSYNETSRGSREFRLTGLTQNTDYYYEIFDELDQLVYSGSFRTLASSTSSGGSSSNVYVEVKNRTTNSAIVDVYTNISYPLTLDLYRGYNSSYNSYFVGKFSETSRGSKEFRLTGLDQNTDYYYEIYNESDNRVIYRGTFRTLDSSTSSGGSSSSSISYEIKTNDINRATIKDVTASIPVSNTNLANSMRDGRDFSTNFEGVTVTYKNGNIEFIGLIPEKEYKNLIIYYTDKNGTSRKVTVATFTTKASETKLRQFMVDVYKYSLNRQADEKGFAYWESQLSRKAISPEKFVGNLLSEREFLNLNTTTTAKIEALYKVIVNRNSDAVGLKYWTDKFDALQKNGYSDSSSLGYIVSEMVNESEFQARVRELGL